MMRRKSTHNLSGEVTRRRFMMLAGDTAIGVALPGCSREPATAAATPPPAAPEAGLPEDLHYASLTDVARLIESRRLSAVELTRAMLERIEAVDDTLKSYATVTTERALAAAEQADQEITNGRYRGPLHGVPVAVKDLCYTNGTRTMGGLYVYRDFRSASPSPMNSTPRRPGGALLMSARSTRQRRRSTPSSCPPVDSRSR